jgi:hypothetical protein
MPKKEDSFFFFSLSFLFFLHFLEEEKKILALRASCKFSAIIKNEINFYFSRIFALK